MSSVIPGKELEYLRRYNLYITEKQLQTLEHLSECGVSVSEHIRIAIDVYLEKLQKTRFSESPSRKEGNGTRSKSGNKATGN